MMRSASTPEERLAVPVPPIIGSEHILTPALLIYPECVNSNIAITLRLLGGQADRWRPHVKTAKLESTMRQFVQHGIRNFKCATTLELLTACTAGAKNILFAYSCIGPKVTRLCEIADARPEVELSALVENQLQVELWRGTRIGIFIDINSGMDRTGIDQFSVENIVELARQIGRCGLRFCGLHYYDGHHSQEKFEKRKLLADAGYRQLMVLVKMLRSHGIPVPEIVTSGTPTLTSAIGFREFQDPQSTHRVSAGTIVYNDLTSLSQLPEKMGYQAAAIVATTVISHPTPDLITCDAGHKTVSVDAGFPNSAVLGHPDLEPLRPSEEHMPIRVKQGARVPKVGEVLFLIPRHICPTVNNFDHALLVRNGRISEVVPVTARGREDPYRGMTVFPEKAVDE
jgi:D-serine deaminase-like pyridoxal phosphate-dependent protein